jgi:hypothetical protein
MGGGALGQGVGGYGATRAGASDVDGATVSDRDDRNVSDQASSASTGPTTARQTRSTVAPCSATTSSNGCTFT